MPAFLQPRRPAPSRLLQTGLLPTGPSGPVVPAWVTTLAAAILTGYPSAATDLDRARCLRDWIARHMIHPAFHFHRFVPAGVGAETLPTGGQRTDLDSLYHVAPTRSITDDQLYWIAYGTDAVAMLNGLMALLTPVNAATGHYRVTSWASYRVALCTYQDVALGALLAGAGLLSCVVRTTGHDPLATWVPSVGRWVYNDPTYNECFVVNGLPATPVELSQVGNAGATNSRMLTTTVDRPTWAARAWIVDAESTKNSYRTDKGALAWGFVGAYLRDVAGRARYVLVDSPAARAAALPWHEYGAAEVVYPDLGCRASVRRTAAGTEVRLTTAQPRAVRFERQVGAAAWQTCGASDSLARDGSASYRSVDSAGASSSVATVPAAVS